MNRLFSFLQGRLRLFPAQQPSPAAPADPPDPFPGRELVFTLIRERLTLQHQVADQQDLKASGIFVGGTTMLGFAFLVQHHPLGNCSDFFPTWLHHWPLIARLALPYVPFLLCYMLAMIFALQASRIRGYWTVPDPVKALKSMNLTEEELKLSLSDMMAHSSKTIEKILDAKAFWIRWAGRLLLGETIALVLLLLYQTIC